MIILSAVRTQLTDAQVILETDVEPALMISPACIVGSSKLVSNNDLLFSDLRTFDHRSVVFLYRYLHCSCCIIFLVVLFLDVFIASIPRPYDQLGVHIQEITLRIVAERALALAVLRLIQGIFDVIDCCAIRQIACNQLYGRIKRMKYLLLNFLSHLGHLNRKHLAIQSTYVIEGYLF